jgi:hypothetical protein
MKIGDVRGDREILGRRFCRQKERKRKGKGKIRTWSVTTAKRKDIWQRIVGQNEVQWREKGQKGGRDRIGIEQTKPKKSTLV